MNGLRDLLKKKEHIAKDTNSAQTALSQNQPPTTLNIPEFTFIRTTTESEEVIQPPDYPGDNEPAEKTKESKPPERRRTLGFRKSSTAAQTRDPTIVTPTRSSLDSAETKQKQNLPVRPKNERRLSDRLHLGGRSRSKSSDCVGSSHLPEDLPDAPEAVVARVLPGIRVEGPGGDGQGDVGEQEKEKVRLEREAAWEKRATMLASKRVTGESEMGGAGNEKSKHKRQHSQDQSRTINEKDQAPRSRSPSISDKPGDEDIQEAIRLHESGDLTKSTEMFGRLANPKGANNALSQVLYGLALRHGWGIPIDPPRAIHYLSLAASNSAAIEQAALTAGMTKGGAAKGELVLAIFELANCFRYGWGVAKDAVAARMYYETAANLGDVDALEESAWCLTEGFGGPKDKFKAAQYLRLAEQKGSKSVGNSWIWKDKYNPI